MRRRKLLIGAGLTAAAGLTALILSMPVAEAAAGLWRHGHRGHHGHGALDPEHIRFGVEWMLRGADASDEQVETIAVIAEAAHGDLHGMRDEHRAGLEALGELLIAEEVDREALDALRAEHMALFDEASGRITAAVADVADVLTSEQRALVIERARERRARWRDRHRDEEFEEE